MSEKQQQINEIFNIALEHSPSERAAFLRQACGNDESLRQEVESLLSHYDQSFLEPATATHIFPASAMLGKQIGPYRVLSECGRGGMAIVYMAERADREYRKRVAIKMVTPGESRDEVLRRFRNERQTLAALDHPNIVKLLDGGSTEDGLPYLVMEYVEGMPVDRYCDAHKLTIGHRLQLFRSICEAVQYAHEGGVIHRDLKPSNILIDCKGIARLMDFGIAKLLNPEYLQSNNNALSNFAANASSGILTVQSGATQATLSNFANAGKMLIKIGSGFSTAGAFTQTSGTTTVDGVIKAPTGMNIQAGLLYGKGTIVSALQSSSTVTPGDSATTTGKLTVSGSYTQNATGTLNIAIGGTTVGSKYDQLAVSNGVSLNGTLNITRVHSFVPVIGNTFTILTASAVSGAFATVTGLSINSTSTSRSLITPPTSP